MRNFGPLDPEGRRPLVSPLPSRGGLWVWLLASIPPLVAGFLAFFRPIWDPDTFWHLAVGREMFWTGSVPTREVFSFTAQGTPWVDTEWLFHALLYPLHRLGGEPLLIVFTALCGVLALLQMARVVRLFGGGPLAFGLACLAILPVLADRVRCRPDLATLLLLGVLAEGLWRDLPRERGALPAFLGGGKPLRDLSLFLAVLFALWGNLHGGWAYGAAFLCAFLLGSLLDLFAAGSLRARHLGRCLLAGSAGALALLLNPYGWRLLWFPVEHTFAMADPTLIPIEEWLPTPLLGYRGFLLGLSALLLVVLALRRRPMALFLPAALQVLLSLAWVRYPALGLYLLAPVAAGEVLAGLRLLAGTWKGPLRAAAWTTLFAFSGLSAHASLPHARLRWDLSSLYPEAEVRFLQENRVSGRVVHPYTAGGYLDWYYYPMGRIFMDGRYFPFAKVLSEYFEALRTFDGFRRFLDRHGAELVLHPHPDYLLPPRAPGEPPRGPLESYFPREEWAPVCFGNWGALYLRRLPRWEAVIARSEYRVLLPDQGLRLRWAVRRGEVDRDALSREVRRFLNEAPRAPMRGEMERIVEACRHGS